jgi:hydrogenase-4 component E
MTTSIEQILFYLEVIIFISIFAMNFVKKNSQLVVMYIIQSLAITSMITLEGIEKSSWQLMITALIILLIKVGFAPFFFFRFVKKSRLNLSTSTYLSVPFSLLAITLITFFANSAVFQPLSEFIGEDTSLTTMLITCIFTSIFILVNRKGSLSQIIGILSLENTIVAIAFFLNISQTLIIEIGILFDVLIWIVLAVIFIDLIYRNLKTVEVDTLNKLNR